MVQELSLLRNQKGQLQERLGMSLGKGLGNALNTYFANRSLNSVLNDKSLQNAPVSRKLEAFRSALAPYGEKGQEILQQTLQIEQQAMNEQKGIVANKLLEGEKLTPQEQSLLSPEEFRKIYEARNPTPQGGITAQPVPQDINQKIGHVLSQSQGMSADELKNIMDSVGIPPIYSNGYIENRRQAQEKGGEHDIKFHQESSDFEKEVQKNANTARKQIPLINNSIKSVKEGKIKPSSLANVFSLFGDTGKKISNALLSGDEAALLASIPEFLEGRKEIFGVRLSDADLAILQDKLPDIGKNKEANLAILNLMKKAAERSIKLEKVAKDVLEKKGLPYRSGKLRPLGYEGEVYKAFEDFERNESFFEGYPPAADHVGKVIEDESGTRYKSNGTSWEPI